MGRLRVTVGQVSKEWKGSGRQHAGLVWLGKAGWCVQDTPEARAWCEANGTTIIEGSNGPGAGDRARQSGPSKTGDRSATGPDVPAVTPEDPTWWCWEALRLYGNEDPTRSLVAWDRYALARLGAVSLRAWGHSVPDYGWSVALFDRAKCLQAVQELGVRPGMRLEDVELRVVAQEASHRAAFAAGREPLVTWRSDAAAALGIKWGAEAVYMDRADVRVKFKALMADIARIGKRPPGVEWAELVLMRWCQQCQGIPDKLGRGRLEWSSVQIALAALKVARGELPGWWNEFITLGGHTEEEGA